MLYFSLIYPYLYYCISVWGSTYPTNLNRIFVLQKRAIRTISKSSFDAHTGPIFKELNILSFHHIYLAQIGKIMFQYKAGLLPACFENIFLLRSQFHDHNTRNANYFSLPKCKTSIKDQNFLIRSAMKYKIRQILLPLNINWNCSFSPKNFLCLVCVTCVCIRSFPPLQLNKSRYEFILCWGSSIHISPMVSFGLPRHVFSFIFQYIHIVNKLLVAKKNKLQTPNWIWQQHCCYWAQSQ